MPRVARSAGHRARHGGAARAAAPLGDDVVRRRRGAGAVGQQVLTRCIRRSRRGRIAANINYDGGNYRGRTRDLTQIGAGKSSLDAHRQRAGREAGPRAGARSVSRQGLLLPLRPVLLRQDRRAGAVLRQWHRLHRQAGGLGQATNTRSGPSTSITSPATSSPRVGVRRHDRGRDDWLRAPAGWSRRPRSMPTWNPGDEFEAARKKAWPRNEVGMCTAFLTDRLPHLRDGGLPASDIEYSISAVERLGGAR